MLAWIANKTGDLLKHSFCHGNFFKYFAEIFDTMVSANGLGTYEVVN